MDSAHTESASSSRNQKSYIVSPRAATEDHKAHSSSRKNKTGNWNPVRAGSQTEADRGAGLRDQERRHEPVGALA
jgi:hypothetical protein